MKFNIEVIDISRFQLWFYSGRVGSMMVLLNAKFGTDGIYIPPN